MDKAFLQEQKRNLEEQKADLEKSLGLIAKKDTQIKDNWKAKYPDFSIKSSDDLSEEADEVEEYDERVSSEQILETELQKVNQALEKIEKGNYGICEKCKKEISIERLKAYPQAQLCIQCEKKEQGGSS